MPLAQPGFVIEGIWYYIVSCQPKIMYNFVVAYKIFLLWSFAVDVSIIAHCCLSDSAYFILIKWIIGELEIHGSVDYCGCANGYVAVYWNIRT